jgi:Spy/CpxP family protein refolding chaperone
MRRLKLAIALSFSLFISIANAEDMAYLLNSTPTERAASQTRFMKTKLSLSQDEVSKIQQINQEYAEKIEPVLKGSDISLFKMRDIKAILEQKDNALRNVLTSEQFDVYINAKDELKQALHQDLTH